jgi:hypothetical protein
MFAMRRSLVGFILAVGPTMTLAQAFSPPESGKTVDQSFQVALMQKQPDECVAWHIHGVELNVKVSIAKARLEEYVARIPKSLWDSRPLMSKLSSPPKAPAGCTEVVFDDISFVTAVFDTAVIEGHALVLDGRTNSPAPYAVIRYSSDAAFGGQILYSIPGQRPFRATPWWVR